MAVIIAMDVDGVIADLHVEWLRRYNQEYEDNLRPEDIVVWEIERLVKPECGPRIYWYLSEPNLYDRVEPVSGAVESVRALRERGHRVVFVTSCVQGMTDPKWRWLQQHGLLPGGRQQTGDFVVCHDKGLVRSDVFVDDYYQNLLATPRATMRVLFTAPYNAARRGPWQRVDSWAELLELVRDIET